MKSYQFWNPNFIISVNKLLKDDPLVETWDESIYRVFDNEVQRLRPDEKPKTFSAIKEKRWVFPSSNWGWDHMLNK